MANNVTPPNPMRWLSVVAGMVANEFNGNRFGAFGTYPLRPLCQVDAIGVYRPRPDANINDPNNVALDYVGHNIAAIAVRVEDDGSEVVIAWAFNHVNFYCSSVEHAEERLIDNLFRTTAVERNFIDSKSLPRVHVYSSLEPCAQCTGKLLLAGVASISFLMADPTANGAFDALLECFGPARAPRTHLSNSSVQPFEQFVANKLNDFNRRARDQIVWMSRDGQVTKLQGVCDGIVYFLCTDAAFQFFSEVMNTIDPKDATAHTFLQQWRSMTPTHRRNSNSK